MVKDVRDERKCIKKYIEDLCELVFGRTPDDLDIHIILHTSQRINELCMREMARERGGKKSK